MMWLISTHLFLSPCNVSVDSDSDNWRRDGRALSPRGGFVRRGRGGMRGRGGAGGRGGRGRGRTDVENLTGNSSTKI